MSGGPFSRFSISMADQPDRILVIVDGSLNSLVGLALAEQNGRAVAWVPPVGADIGDGPIGKHHLASVRVQLDRLNIEQVVFPPDDTATPSELGERALGINTSVSLALVRASHDAFQLRCRSILWPACAGHSLDDAFKLTEIASLVSRLVALDQPGTPKDIDLAVRTPLADMTREQVADLAYDLDVPTECCWAMRTHADLLSPTMVECQKQWQDAIVLAAKMRGWESTVQLPTEAGLPTAGNAYV